MKLATIIVDEQETSCIVTRYGYLPVYFINRQQNKNWPHDLFGILTEQKLGEIQNWYNQNSGSLHPELQKLIIPEEETQYAPLYRKPRKIWGIGLNYQEHARDLSEMAPTSLPASFMKPDTTIIGHESTIKIPLQSERTTGEAELGLVINKKCKNVKRKAVGSDFRLRLTFYVSVG